MNVSLWCLVSWPRQQASLATNQISLPCLHRFSSIAILLLCNMVCSEPITISQWNSKDLNCLWCKLQCSAAGTFLASCNQLNLHIRLRSLCQQEQSPQPLLCSVAVVMGISERCKGGRTCYNATVAYDKDGTLLGVHRKLLPTYAERYVWGRGDGSGLLAWDSSVGRIGSLICWEHTMNLARHKTAHNTALPVQSA